jgi:hypothetical protein
MQTGHSAQHPEEEWIQQFVGILFSFTCHTGPKKKKTEKHSGTWEDNEPYTSSYELYLY